MSDKVRQTRRALVCLAVFRVRVLPQSGSAPDQPLPVTDKPEACLSSPNSLEFLPGLGDGPYGVLDPQVSSVYCAGLLLGLAEQAGPTLL